MAPAYASSLHKTARNSPHIISLHQISRLILTPKLHLVCAPAFTARLGTPECFSIALKPHGSGFICDIQYVRNDPPSGHSADKLSRSVIVRALAWTNQPSSLKRRARARPIPLPAPVTHADLLGPQFVTPPTGRLGNVGICTL